MQESSSCNFLVKSFEWKKFPQNRLSRTPETLKNKKYCTSTHDFSVGKISTKPSESYPGFVEKIPQFANRVIYVI